MAFQHVTPDGLVALREQEPVSALLDVREVEEAFVGHLPGSVSVPLRRIPFWMQAMLPNADIPVVVTDDGLGDSRAKAAADLLVAHGVQRAFVLDGGLGRWAAEGRTVESGQNVPSKRFGEALTAVDDFHIQPDTLERWLREGRAVQIIDVRTAAEHARECLPGSLHAPGFSAVAAADRSRTVVVHCSGRTRSIIAALTLRLLGVEDAWALENGTMGWMLAGKDVERGTARPALVEGLGGSPEVTARAREVALRVGVVSLSPEQARSRASMADGHPRYLLDVRELGELAGRTAEGARQAPSGQVIQATDEHVPLRGVGVVLIDDGGARAWLVGHWLALLGFDDVAVVDGGLPAWEAAGLPVATYVPDPDPVGLEAARAAVTLVTADDAVELVASGAVRVHSVDLSADFEAAHVPGAGWLPLSDVLAERPLPTVDLTQPVLVTCRDGRGSALAGQRLRQRGMKDVKVLDGGLAAWQEVDGPIERGRGDLPDIVEDVHPHATTVGEDAMSGYLTWEIGLDHEDDSDRIAGRLDL